MCFRDVKDDFHHFFMKTDVVGHMLIRIVLASLMSTHKLEFYEEISKIISEYREIKAKSTHNYHKIHCIFKVWTDIADPNQTASRGAIQSLFAILLKAFG